MSEIDRLIARFREQHDAELEAWAKKTHAEVKAMAEARRRGLAQLFRHATRRVREAQQGALQ